MTLEEYMALLSVPPPLPDTNPSPPMILLMSSLPPQLMSDTTSYSYSANTTPAAANM